MTKETFSFHGYLKVAIWMKLWSPGSEIMEFLISSYRIVQQSSVKFCTLLKMTLGTLLFSFHLGVPIQVQSWPSLRENEDFQPLTDLLFSNISLT